MRQWSANLSQLWEISQRWGRLPWRGRNWRIRCYFLIHHITWPSWLVILASLRLWPYLNSPDPNNCFNNLNISSQIYHNLYCWCHSVSRKLRKSKLTSPTTLTLPKVVFPELKMQEFCWFCKVYSLLFSFPWCNQDTSLPSLVQFRECIFTWLAPQLGR